MGGWRPGRLKGSGWLVRYSQPLNPPCFGSELIMARILKPTKVLHSRRAISNLVVTLIIIGVGAGMAFAALGGIQDNLGSLTGSNRVVITDVSAFTSGDRMVVTGNMQNLGSQPLTSITIDEITAGDMVITQRTVIEDGVIDDGHGDLLLSGKEGDGSDIEFTTAVQAETVPSGITSGNNVYVSSITAAPNTYYFAQNSQGSATITLTGFSTDDDADLEPLAAGSSKSFRVVVTGISSGTNPDVLDVLRTVPASTDLFITVTGTDGQTTTTFDPRSTRVTAR